MKRTSTNPHFGLGNAPKNAPKVALVGISGYGRVHLRLIEAAAARGEIHFVAAVVINRDDESEACERLEANGVILFETWEAMLQNSARKLDLCVIPVPIFLHEKLTIAALEAGANVLVEKPLAASVDQVKAIQQAERRTGHWVAVGFQDFYCPSVRGIAADLGAGRIGRLRSIKWLGLWPRAHAYYSRNNWAGRMQVGGNPVRDSPLNNAMAHFVNLSLMWAGAGSGKTAWPEYVVAELFRCGPIESFDTAVMRIKTDTNVSVQAAVTHRCPVAHPIQMNLQGDLGELNWTHKRKAIWSTQDRSAEEIELETSEEAVEAMFETVLARLKDSTVQICTSDQALPQVACIESIHESATIQNVDGSCLTTGQFGTSSPIIQNVERDLKDCLRRGALPSELGLTWARNSLEATPLSVPVPVST